MFRLPRSGFWHARESLWSFERGGCSHYNQETPVADSAFLLEGGRGEQAMSFGAFQPSVSFHGAKAFTWPNEPPADIPFERSDLFTEAASRI